MILVVEGPSAAGKTTWCRQHTAAVVAEYTPTGGEPDGSDLPAQAAFWTTVNVARWAQALATEARAGIAVCDTDPLKLHYSWSLARIGAAPRGRFDHELTQVRAAFAEHVLGLADLVLVSNPPLDVLRAHRNADTTRRRRSFDLHARLGESLRAWYQALLCGPAPAPACRRGAGLGAALLTDGSEPGSGPRRAARELPAVARCVPRRLPGALGRVRRAAARPRADRSPARRSAAAMSASAVLTW